MNFEGKQQSLLTFRVGPVLCCAPSLPVRSIITPPKLTHLPGSDSSQPGIFKHGSHIVKVLDLRQKFGIEQSEQTQPGNLIITIFETESFAFWVDQILDVFDFPSEGWGNLPAAIPRGVFSRTLLLNKKIHLYSEFEKLATIKDLGYLKHYIQQLKKQQDAQETEHEHKNTTLKGASPVKSNEIKHNPIKEVKNEQIIKKDKPAHIEKTVSKTSSLSSTPTRIPASKNKTPKIEIKKIPVVQPVVTRPIITSATSTQAQVKTKKHNKKPAVIIKEKPDVTSRTSSSTGSTIENDAESSSFGIILLFIFILFSLGTGIYYLFINTVVSTSNNKYTQKQTSISAAAPADYNINETGLNDMTSIQDEMNSRPEILNADTVVEKNDKPLNNENKKVINELMQSEDNSITEDATFRADIVQQDNDITIMLHQPISEIKPHQETIIITPQQPDDIMINEIELEAPPVKNLKNEEFKQTIKAEKTINKVIHIVVKGDTLWAIAKKYIHDPFLYPELARLSNIKNPHLIYPGNLVRIRFIKE